MGAAGKLVKEGVEALVDFAVNREGKALAKRAPRPRIKPEIRTDNPGGEWLKHERARAIKNYGQNNPVTGAVTGYLRKPIHLDPQKLVNIPGARGEVRVPGEAQYDRLRPSVEKHGLYEDSPILVGVNHLGEPYIIEGNTRAAVARDLGIDRLPAEVRYFAGGEQVGGPMEPGLIEHYMSPSELSLDPNFRRWFEGSKGVDEYGEPMRFYHGSNVWADSRLGQPFNAFDRMAVPRLLAHRKPSMDQVGSWFSDRADRQGAGMYTFSRPTEDVNPYIMPLYLKYTNPWETSFEDFLKTGNAVSGRAYDPAARPGSFDPEPLRSWLKERGHDAIQFPRDGVEGDQAVTVVLEPTQIKSAIGNRGTYDPNDADITKACGGRVRGQFSRHFEGYAIGGRVDADRCFCHNPLSVRRAA